MSTRLKDDYFTTVTISRALAADYELRNVFLELRPGRAHLKAGACYRYRVDKLLADRLFEDAVQRKAIGGPAKALRMGLTEMQRDITRGLSASGYLSPHSKLCTCWSVDADPKGNHVAELFHRLGILQPSLPADSHDCGS